MSAAGRIVSIQVGRTQGYQDAAGKRWTSAIRKLPIDGPVEVAALGLTGDQQANPEVHGGPDKAVLAYSIAHYPLWRAEPGLADAAPGGFGENLTVEGFDEQTVCLGDVWEVGSARLQVAQPRQPCVKLARRWALPELQKRVIETRRGGWYLRVLAPGRIAAGEAIARVARPWPEATVARVFALSLGAERDPAAARALAEHPLLTPGYRKQLLAAAAHSS